MTAATCGNRSCIPLTESQINEVVLMLAVAGTNHLVAIVDCERFTVEAAVNHAEIM